jgi:hypothetical protein
LGQRQKKNLFIGVRNKYCTVCERISTQNSEKTDNDHVCFKNYNGPSTAMETDVILDGFRKSVEMHGLIYGKLIGDVDSSVYKKLLQFAPYGPQFHIEKIECKNHVLRNYITKLTELKNNTAYGINQRKVLASKVEKCRIAVSSAINYWTKEDTLPFNERVLKLKENISNGLMHVFGDHGMCIANPNYYCTEETRAAKRAEGEENLVPILKEKNFLGEIIFRNKRVAENSWSLLHNVTNNLAEAFNAVVGKYVGGKRINFSGGGGYTMRCEAAAVSFNSNRGFYHKELQDKILRNGAGKYTEKYCKKIVKIRQRVRNRTYHKKNAAGPDSNYGQCENIPDKSAEELKKAESTYLANLSKNIKEIEEDTKQQAFSNSWRKERKKRITASNFGRVCKMRKSTSTKKIVENLLYGTFVGNESTKYGQNNELKAIRSFELQTSLKTKPSGLIIDKDRPFLAGSPDAILEDNSALVEIKCPATAKNLTPEEAVKQKKIKFATLVDGKLKLKERDNFMYQIQGQMFVSGINTTYFVVFTQKGMSIEKIQKNEEFCSEMVSKLTNFYFGALLPELLDSRRSRQLPIRDFFLK